MWVERVEDKVWEHVYRPSTHHNRVFLKLVVVVFDTTTRTRKNATFPSDFKKINTPIANAVLTLRSVGSSPTLPCWPREANR
jgi:hypothetical protein